MTDRPDEVDELDDSAWNKPAVDVPGFRHEVSRPKPTAVWKFPWQYQDLMGRTQEGQIELEASYADSDSRLGEPDRFDLLATPRGRGGVRKLVLSREGAVELHKALGEALAWDGQ